MSEFQVTQAAKLARFHRIAANLYRKTNEQKRTRQHEGLARKQEAKVRDYATAIELA